MNGSVVAVKKLDMSNRGAKEDYEIEVRLISNVHHRNLVRLLGCYTKGSELLLVLEYMENGSLDRFLYGDRRGSLNWKQRFDMIFGTAKGLAYLHEHYFATMIHRDNILVDNPRLLILDWRSCCPRTRPISAPMDSQAHCNKSASYL